MTPQELLTSNKCIDCLTPGQKETIQTVALLRLLEFFVPCIAPTITTTTMINAVYQVPYSKQIEQTGTTAVFTLTGGSLPTGLTLSSTGLISGTPTVTQSTTFTITATNSCGSDTQLLALEVSCVNPVITTATLPAATNGVGYSQMIHASGTPSTFAVVSGALPTGLSLSSGGTLSGTPSANGTFNFTVRATNACGTDDQAYTVVTSAACVAPIITTVSLPAMVVGTAYSQTIVASGNTSVFTLFSGSLPAGLTLSSAGVLAGTPTTAGAFSFTVLATNACGTDTQAYSGTVAAACVPPTITTTSLGGGTVGTVYSQTVVATGDASTFTVSAGSLPPGLTLSSAGVIAGTPTTAGTYNFTVLATNACGTDPQALSIVVILTPTSIIWGNYIWADTPAAAPVFVEANLTGVNALFVDRNSSTSGTRVGNYTFATRAAARQVMWMANSLGTPSFLVSGIFPWALDPAANTALQNLTVAGVAGKVYFTSEQNGGTYTVACS